MHATVSWLHDQQYDAVSHSGHHVAMDADAAHQGGPGPMEMVLMGLCSCTSVDVGSILRKKREPLTSLTVSEAVHKTANLGLNLGIDNKYYSVDVPAGRVLAQSPLPGAIVRREWRMRVTESLGPQRVAIPKVVGQQERVAAIEVRRVGLGLEETAQMPYSGAPPGTGIPQNPHPGAPAYEARSRSMPVQIP